jgi:hypothetical protein
LVKPISWVTTIVARYWQEPDKASAGSYENVYANMPPFGMGKAGVLQPASSARQSASGRLGGEHNAL